MAISYNEALAKLATITDETGLRALIEQLDAAGDQSSRVTALWSGTQDDKFLLASTWFPRWKETGPEPWALQRPGSFWKMSSSWTNWKNFLATIRYIQLASAAARTR